MNGHYPISAAVIWASPLPLAESVQSIAFNGYSLQSSNIITSEINFDDIGTVELNSFKYPRDNGGGILSKFYRGREIKLKLTIKETTGTSFNTLLDTFKKSISKTEGYLDILVNTEVRRIKATCTNIDFGRKHYNVTFITAQVTFTAVEPFFYTKTQQSFEYLANTASFAQEFTNQGSAPSLPALYFLFGAGSSVTQLDVAAFGKTLSIANTFSSGDILIIKAAEKSITKNGVEIDYTGQFPEFQPGSCPFSVNITGAVLVDLTVTTPKNYL